MGFKVERESDKLTVSSCVSKTECIETINIVLNFRSKKLAWFCERSYLEDLLQKHFSSDDWYFVPSFNIKSADNCSWKFAILVDFSLKKDD